VLEEGSISALSACIETAGANIILWDDLWRSVSRLLSGATLEAVLQSHGSSNTSAAAAAAAAADNEGATNSISSVPEATSSSTGESVANQRPRSDSEELAAAIAASLGQTVSTDAPTRPNTPPRETNPEIIPEDATEEEQIAMAIAASLGNPPSSASSSSANSQSVSTPQPQAPAANQRPRSDSEELAAAIAASLEPASTPPPVAVASVPISSLPSANGCDSAGGESGSAAAPQIGRNDSMDEKNGEVITLYHYNGMMRGNVGAPRLVKFSITKRGNQEMVMFHM
jgi:Na+-transporting methylmalonyl-CoA/oxaloacetate decarboxylase gamma subunit